ncbi:hypothetical protein [Aquamicrobium sp. LC103]|uniref:hypothetical protein n=1 Tax=Aquamicrobium sp. LC103 TaxID=1120658 RepID=UPI00063E8A68|nr:hypothetical protein [Aquamicrobium sp. LC103]TKT69308.1 hypothetical protein XW59_027630 [Aquamicrobium sp. LC103]
MPLADRLVAFSLMLAPANAAFAQSAMQFPDASETVPELVELWDQSNSTCRGANGGDVRVAAACLSRSVYGVAINERNWCLGKDGQANAEMVWHECETDSLRFPPFDVPEL